MININIVKEQYQQMHDEQLKLFAKNESQSLTIESFHALKDELERRDIDLSFLEEMQTERELQEVNKLSEFEKVTAFEFTKTIWQFAFDEKEKGVSNKQLFAGLLEKNIKPEYALMLIQSIEPKTKEMLEDVDTWITVKWIAAIFGGLLILFNYKEPNYYFFCGLVIAFSGVVSLASAYSRQRKLRTILKNIEADEKEAPTNLYQ